MADRPMASTSRAGRPKMRSRSVHLPTHIPVASKAVRPRAKSVQKTQVKGKGKGTGKGKKKPGKAAIVISSDSENSEVDFPHYPPNQPENLPAEEPEQPNQPLDVPSEGPGEPPEEPNNPNPLPENQPVPMANNQLNWSHFKPEFSGKPEEDAEAHLLRTNDWMTTHDFPDDQKVMRFCLTLSGEARLWYETLNTQQ